MAGTVQGCLTIMKKNKPYSAMILVQFIVAGMSLLSKASVTKGMNPYVFVAYRQAVATLTLAPFAFFLERSKKYPPLSWSLLCQMFVVSIGITMALNLFYLSLNYVSATFVIALSNINPTITFIMAVCFRMEKLCIKQRHGMVKVIGSTLSFAGALLCTFVRGAAVYPERSSQRDILHLAKQNYSKSDWIKGSIIILAAYIAWCSWLIMQGALIKRYPAKLRFSTLQSLFSCATTAIWAATKERNIESWKLGWNVNLLSIFYCGVVAAAINYSLQVWVIEKKGPVFVAVFSPLALIITAIFSALLFQETLRWGSVCGAILLVIGLYGILWAKSKEGKSEASNLQLETEVEVEVEEGGKIEQKQQINKDETDQLEPTQS